MPMDEDAVLHFEAVVLDDEAEPWTGAKVEHVISALKKVGIRAVDDVDPGTCAAAAGDDRPIPCSGGAGYYELLLEPIGGWWWDTPYATLMRGRHTNRPEAVEELVGAVRAILGVATPYYGCSWLSDQVSPLWLRTTDPFKAQDGKAVQFFSRRYLEENLDGKTYVDPPAKSETLAGGQLLIADQRAFGEATVTAVQDLTDYLQTVRFPLTGLSRGAQRGVDGSWRRL